MCINSYHSPMTKRIFQMNSRKYQNTGGKVEVLPPPHSDPLYNEVSNSFFNQIFRKCQLILGILINFSSLSKWNLTENWYLPITISKNTYCLYFRLYFRLFSHSRSLCRDVYILCHKSALTKPFLFGSFFNYKIKDDAFLSGILCNSGALKGGEIQDLILGGGTTPPFGLKGWWKSSDSNH